MSHISTYSGTIKDIDALKAVCAAAGIACKVGDHVVTQYGRNTIDAVASFRLDGWGYDIAVDGQGKVLYDHFGSQANSFERLGELMQGYNEKVITDKAWGVADNVWTEESPNGDRVVVLEFS